MQHISRSEADTASIAAALAPTLKAGDVVCLHGALGMGKSVFARALIRTLCNDSGLDVPSPTFTLVQVYETDGPPVWHFDLYRLEDPDEIFELGWEEARASAILLAEWPERIGPLLPQRRIDIQIENEGESARRITVSGLP